MKNSRFRFIAFLGMLVTGMLFSSCQQKSPRGVAEHYLEAFHDHDYEEAKKYATDDTKKLLDMFISFAALTPDSLKPNLHFKVLEEKVKGDTAWVNYRLEGSNKIQSLTLLRSQGTWKVAASKDSLNELEGAEALDSGATLSDTTSAGTESADSLGHR